MQQKEKKCIKIDEVNKSGKIKSSNDFDEVNSNSIESIAVKKIPLLKRQLHLSKE